MWCQISRDPTKHSRRYITSWIYFWISRSLTLEVFRTWRQRLDQSEWSFLCSHITIYNWCMLLRLTSIFVNPRKWWSPRRRRGENHFQGLTNTDVNLNSMHELFCYMPIFSCLAAVTKVMLTGPNPAIFNKHFSQKIARLFLNDISTLYYCLTPFERRHWSLTQMTS